MLLDQYTFVAFAKTVNGFLAFTPNLEVNPILSIVELGTEY
jgi:hypothetical protein